MSNFCVRIFFLNFFSKEGMEILNNIDESKAIVHLVNVLKGYEWGDEISMLTILLSRKHMFWGNEFKNIKSADVLYKARYKGFVWANILIEDMFDDDIFVKYKNHNDFYIKWSLIIKRDECGIEYETMIEEACKYNNIKQAEILYRIVYEHKNINGREIELLEKASSFGLPNAMYRLAEVSLLENPNHEANNLEIGFKYLYEAHLYDYRKATNLLKKYLGDYPISIRGIYICLAELYLGTIIIDNISFAGSNYVRSWKYCKFLIKDAISDQCGVRACILLYTIPQFKAIEKCQNAIITMICIWKYRRNTLLHWLPKDILYYLKNILWLTNCDPKYWNIIYRR